MSHINPIMLRLIKCVGGVRDVESVKEITRGMLQRSICAMINTGEWRVPTGDTTITFHNDNNTTSIRSGIIVLANM